MHCAIQGNERINGMKLLKKILIGIALFVLAELLIYLIGTGFIRNRFVEIRKWEVSDSGEEITVTVSVPSSIGYVRKVKESSREGGKLCLDCYSAFGGINGRIGAKSSYTLLLGSDVNVIALYRGDGTYEDVLYKAADGTWQEVD